MKKYIVVATMLLSLLLSGVSTSVSAAPAAGTGTKKTGTVKKVKVKKKKVASTADYSVLNFAPFGVGHFVQGRPIMGSILGGGQAVMLFLYLDRQKQIDASNKDASATIAEVDASGLPPDQETTDYLSRNAAYVKKTGTESTLTLVGFMGLYAISVVDAIYDPFGGRAAAAKKVVEIENMDDDASKWVAQKKFDDLINTPRFSMFALPTSGDSKGTIGLSLQKSFR